MSGIIIDAVNFRTKVTKIHEKIVNKWVSGKWPDATFREESHGWFVKLEGSYESIYVGMTKPNVSVGDIANIRIAFSKE